MTSDGSLSKDQVTTQVAYWQGLCEYDLETAKAMQTSRRFLYVGFMSHQVVEKGLKALYIHLHHSFPPRIHALVELAKRTGVYENLTETQQALLDTLEPLNIECRYPAQRDLLLAALTESRCRELLEETEEIHKWINTRLSSE
jgi:HEPN domain-containing protein